MSENAFTLRPARPDDAAAVTAVLASAYPRLMAADYDPAVLAIALPVMTAANPGLLASGTYYVQALPDGRIVSCGGWTQEAPGTKQVERGIAHVRHFATHADWIRKGLGAGIFHRCDQEARAAGIHTFKCFSSLGAAAFYAALGFQEVERIEIALRGDIGFATVVRIRTER